MITKSTFISPLAILIGTLMSASACQTTVTPEPAIITVVNMAALTEALETATGQTNISIVPAVPIGAKSISVPPPPLGKLETRSPALPRQFAVMQTAGNCVLFDESSGQKYTVNGLLCQPIEE